MPFSQALAILGAARKSKPIDLEKARSKIKSLEDDASEMVTRLDIPLVVVDAERVKILARRIKNQISEIL